MADDKTYSESEHIAILADRITRETADITAERDALSGEKSELETKLDIETSAKEAAELRATEAETALETFKQEVADREAASARKDERLTKVREAASHLDDKFFEDESRIARIVAFDEDQFAGYLADLGATALPGGKSAPAVPRETAMSGAPGGNEGGAAPLAKAGQGFLMREYNIAPAAPKEA